MADESDQCFDDDEDDGPDEDRMIELHDADENCSHVFDPTCMSGIKCTKCGGWFCY